MWTLFLFYFWSFLVLVLVVAVLIEVHFDVRGDRFRFALKLVSGIFVVNFDRLNSSSYYELEHHC